MEVRSTVKLNWPRIRQLSEAAVTALEQTADALFRTEIVQAQVMPFDTGHLEEGQWLVRMVENLLSITRIGDGTARIDKEDELVEDVISGAITKFRKRFPDIEVVPKVPEDVLFVPMDAILIEQVIVNLLENCVLHADGMTKIWLIVTEDGDQVKFSVEDDGAGIKESALPRMFDGSFQSEDGKESDSKRNMGIGLSVCMTIVRAHDGIMKAENRKEGGARVMFWLPKGVDTEYGD